MLLNVVWNNGPHTNSLPSPPNFTLFFLHIFDKKKYIFLLFKCGGKTVRNSEVKEESYYVGHCFKQPLTARSRHSTLRFFHKLFIHVVKESVKMNISFSKWLNSESKINAREKEKHWSQRKSKEAKENGLKEERKQRN